jgi:hypothetical protein
MDPDHKSHTTYKHLNKDRRKIISYTVSSANILLKGSTIIIKKVSRDEDLEANKKC